MNSEIYYKYLDIEGAKKTLKNQSLKFSRAEALNDPFELRIDELLGAEPQEFHINVINDLCTLILGDQKVDNTRINMMRYLASKDKNIMIEEVNILSDIMNEMSLEVRRIMDSYGVFCISSKKDNTVMWSHYAEHHSGCVLGIKPLHEKDSVLRLLEPVTYSNNRPIFYKDANELWKVYFANDPMQHIRNKFEELIYTKSLEWAFEQEYRLYVPDIIKEGSNYCTLLFYPEELIEIYLGCRMSDEDEIEIKALAIEMNKNVKIYKVELAPRDYAMHFKLL